MEVAGLGFFILCCFASWGIFRYVDHQWPPRNGG